MKRAPRTPVYAVETGDCLWDIAEDQYGDPTVWPEIARANLLRIPYWVFVGQKLRLFPVEVGSVQSAPPTLRGISSTATSAPTTSSLSLQASRVARLVAFPAFKYSLEKLPKYEVVTPQFRYSLQLKGELTLQRRGVMPGPEISKEGITTELKKEADTELVKLTSGTSVTISPDNKIAEVKCELAIAAKINGHVFATQKVAIIPPSSFRYTYEPREITGEHGFLVFKGTFGYQLDWTKLDQPRSPQPAPAFVPHQTNQPAAAVVLIGVGVVLVAILAPEILAGAVLAADEVVSFATVAAMIGQVGQ